MKFRLESTYSPSGDQPEAISQLSTALAEGVSDIALLGVTGSERPSPWPTSSRNSSDPPSF